QIENATSTNQTTSTPIQVVTSEDLSIEPTDIQFTAADGGLVQISVTVHENGDAVSQPFEVGVYQGDPATGTVIGTPTLASLAASGSATVTVAWNPSTANGPTPITAVADVQNVVPDANRANNTATRDYSAPVGLADLAVLSTGVVFTPSILHPNVPENVQVYVQNVSAVDAYGVQVEFCPVTNELQQTCLPGTAQVTTLDRVPANKGVAVANFTLPGSAITLPPEASAGELFFEVVVDPLQLIPESTRVNNQVFLGVGVSLNASLYATLGVTCVSSANGPGTVSFGGEIAITGAGGPLTVPYAIYEGKPEAGGRQIYSGLLAPSIQGGTFQVQGLPGSANPNPLYVLVADPANTLHNLTPYLGRASASCYSVPNTASALSMSYDDIRFSPVGPAIGETTTVTASVRNIGSVTSTATLMAFVGDPTTAAGQKLAEFPLSIAPGQSATTSFPWTRSGEETNIYFGLFDVVPFQYHTYTGSDVGKPAGNYQPNQTSYYTYRNSFLEAVYTSGRVETFVSAQGLAPQTSPPTVGDLLRTGQPVIGYGEALEGYGDGGLSDQEYSGSLTLVQKFPDNSLQTVWTKQVDHGVGQPVFVDLGVDAGPQIVFLSVVGPYVNSFYNGQPGDHAFRGNVIHVWNPDGTVAWERSYVLGPDGGPADACMNEDNLVAPGVGDVNGDGVVDVVFPTADGIVHVLDGRTGAPIWEASLPSSEACRTYESQPAGWQPSVLDLFGDGGREVVIGVSDTPIEDSSRGNVRIFSSSGQDLTGDGGGVFGAPLGYTNLSSGNLAVTDFSGPGAVPSLISSSAVGWAQADSPSGQQIWLYNDPARQVFQGPFAVADGTACGTPLLFLGALGGPFVMGGDGKPVWYGDTEGHDGYPGTYSPVISRAVVAADLLGLGSPQYLGVANENALFILDGRTGADLLKTHLVIADPGNGDDDGEFSDLAVADVDGDGHGEVVMNVQADWTDYGYSPGYESHASLYVFGSDAHWKPMANVWSGNQYHHQFNPDLTLTADAYAP
ncbi:MAG: CARDB domain-containing protein, partial [Acidimicrobiales bacterium]